ncbi:hypothetical protein Tco_0930493 [Tanacetum coccineum]
MFDEYFIPPSAAISLVQVAIAQRAVVLANSPMSTSIDQDGPSSSIPSTQEQEHSPNISQSFEESPKTPTCDVPLRESLHEESTSQGSSSNGKQVDATLYRGMIRSLMYLTFSRPDLIYAVCLCARYQAKPIEKHLQAVKRIFRYLKGTINMGL